MVPLVGYSIDFGDIDLRRTLLTVVGAVAASTVLATFPNLGVDTTFIRLGQVGGINFTSGSGTVISPSHVLTARHVGGTRFWMRDDGVNISGFVDSISRLNHPAADLAILTFAPNTFSDWYRPIYANQLGATPIMVGFGLTANLRANGTGYNSVSGSSSIRRVTTNTADLRMPGIANTVSLWYDLDGAPGAPGDANSMGSGNPISGEGGILSGDSGGAWLLPNGASWNLIGVNSFIFNAGGGNTLNDFLDWGDGGGAVDVNAYSAWIEANAPVPEPASMAVLGLGIAALAARRRRRK